VIGRIQEGKVAGKLYKNDQFGRNPKREPGSPTKYAIVEESRQLIPFYGV
jgi:hypothetical protein